MSDDAGMEKDATIERLEDQIAWYDKRSSKDQRKYKLLRGTVIVAAALIPFVSGFPAVPRWVAGALGMVIAVAEGIQQLNQYHANWTSYRATAEALKHEKYLFLAGAGPYAAAGDRRALLAESIESLVSQEHAKWTSGKQEKLDKPKEQ
jgi:Protein of unknown function (DUF4231)